MYVPGGTVGYPAPPRLIRLSVCESVDTKRTIQPTGSWITVCPEVCNWFCAVTWRNRRLPSPPQINSSVRPWVRPSVRESVRLWVHACRLVIQRKIAQAQQIRFKSWIHVNRELRCERDRIILTWRNRRLPSPPQINSSVRLSVCLCMPAD